MTSVARRDADRLLPITGYLDRISGRPGDLVEVKVSAQGAGDFGARLVRIICADPNPAGPGLKYEPIPAGFAGRYPARVQGISLGSYARVDLRGEVKTPRLVVSSLVQPWLLRAERSVIVAASDGDGGSWSLEASESDLAFVYRPANGAKAEAVLPIALERRRWYRLWGGYDALAGRLMLGASALDGDKRESVERDVELGPLAPLSELSLAAAIMPDGAGRHFNGRLEGPVLLRNWPAQEADLVEPAGFDDGSIVAWWDFSRAIDSQTILDRGPSGFCGRLINVPTRAVRGARWTGEEMCWRHAPHAYAAIHFHEDDLYDCGWDTDFTFTLPDDLKSGIYGVELSQGEAEDVLPFYLLPPRGKPSAKICFLAPTFTYQAYANHARGNCDTALRARMADWGANPYNADDYPIYGRSTYNLHPDGSGHAYSSRLRPVLTWRPGYLSFCDERGSGLRHFSADSHLTDWLEARGFAFDVITDEDLDNEGIDLIRSYATVLTGSHPEYHTAGTLDALGSYTAEGGNLVYLGGNGFYWRIARSRVLPCMIELRRAEGGIRAWAAEPGEYHHAIDGSYGGLWRRNGRPPQQLAGIGFSAQGLFEGSYYRRMPASEKPEVAWIFEGVAEDRIGDYGLSGGGAAGFELDRADYELGSPSSVLVLARSEGHGESFIVVPEEILSHTRTVPGEDPSALVRGEMVYFRTPGGGAVFSVGSITFCGSLSHAGYDNGISRILENVLRRFSSDA